MKLTRKGLMKMNKLRLISVLLGLPNPLKVPILLKDVKVSRAYRRTWVLDHTGRVRERR